MAEGIVKVLQNILQKNGIAPEEVVFIAHGTTQATNALLEGDVACTGILAMGSGLEAGRAKTVSDIGNIPLALGKELKTVYSFVETADAKADEQEIAGKIKELKDAGAEVIVATEAYSVDDPAKRTESPDQDGCGKRQPDSAHDGNGGYDRGLRQAFRNSGLSYDHAL